MSEDFAHRVVAYRKREGISQEELANRLGITRNWVSMLEGGRSPSDQLQRSFQMLELSPLTPRESRQPTDSTPTARVAEEEWSAPERGRLAFSDETLKRVIDDIFMNKELTAEERLPLLRPWVQELSRRLNKAPQ